MVTITYKVCDRCGEQISNLARSSIVKVEQKGPASHRAGVELVPAAFDLCSACTNAFTSFMGELRKGGDNNSETKTAD